MIKDRLKHAWNAFMNKDPTPAYTNYYGGYSMRPDRPRFTGGSERSNVTDVLNRIAIDAASLSIRHVKLDDNERYLEDVKSDLNHCFKVSSNLDQIPRAFFQDVVMSMLDEGCVAIVPVETTLNPQVTGGYDIQSLRTGKITQWFPDSVEVRLYNERTGKKEDIRLPKSVVAIVENPFYSVMNEPNSTLRRLLRKLSLMDIVDEATNPGKLDLIIQLPYIIKTEARRRQAEQRRKDIEDQLAGSTYGIAYTDGTEHVTQLNRSLENNLLKHVEYLTDLFYAKLGITVDILNGTANETTMQNYYTRTIEPIVSAIVDEMKRKFLTKTAITQKQTIMFFRDPFKLMPTSNVAEIADKFTRNEIMTSNEIRQIVGMKPSDDPTADELRNKNLSQPKELAEQTYGNKTDTDSSEDLVDNLLNKSK